MLLALATTGLPVAAAAGCLSKPDMHALQAASLQQRLMVAAFTCHNAAAYNAFVLGHRSELQRSDAALLAFFQKNGGTAAYNAYKTHLANASALESSRDDGFCSNAGGLFHAVSAGGALGDVLDELPTADTGYAACYATEARAAPRTRQAPVRTADTAPPSPRMTRPDRNDGYDRRHARNHDDYSGRPSYDDDDRYADSRFDRGPDNWNNRDDYDPRDDRDGRYAWRGDDRDGPMYDGPPQDDDSDW